MESKRQIEQAAAAWLVRRDLEEWNHADEAELEAWLSASTARRVAFIRLQAAWQQVGRLKARAAGMSKNSALLLGDRPGTLLPAKSEAPLSRHENLDAGVLARNAQRPRTRVPRMLAASVAAVFLAAPVVVRCIAWAHPLTSYPTAIGGISSLSMKDGSTGTLNTNNRNPGAIKETQPRGGVLGRRGVFFG